MKNDQKHIALLYFSRSPLAESRHKRFVNRDSSKNRQVADLLVSQSLKHVENSGLPYFLFDETRQKGDTFGERLTNAFDELFKKGFDGVIAVGNDCPGLGSVNWELITQIMKQNRPVLGPTPDGGSYLIGLTRESFHNDSFRQIPWKTRNVHQSLCKYLKSGGFDLYEIDAQRDINKFDDLLYFLKTRFTGILKHFKELLKNLFRSLLQVCHLSCSPQSQSLCVYTSRPPPLLLY
jgi:glycosyltransferase A (GT-A) superfamily protein (DUF2064 family)